jgi:hypothetical protein
LKNLYNKKNRKFILFFYFKEKLKMQVFTPSQAVFQLEKNLPELINDQAWAFIKEFVEKKSAKRLILNSVYKFKAKKGRIARGVVTKENDKTWVLYEVDGSGNPGTRWMLSKSWCTKTNVWRDEAQSYSLPSYVRVK